MNMRNFTQPFYSVLFVFFWCGLLSQAYAQRLAYHDLPPQEDQTTQKALRVVLEELETEYGVNFTYQSDLIENKQVDQGLEQALNDLDRTLDKLLKPLDLEHRRVDDQYYLIYPAIKPLERQKIEKVKRQPDAKSATSMAGIPDSYSSGTPHRNDLLVGALEKTISGMVTDLSTAESLPGVNIVAKGTTIGTVTDIDGNYRLTVPDEATILVFSSVGYITQEVAINERSVIDMQMEPDVQSLEEIVVVGYGTVKKSDLTGAVSSVKVDELNKGVVSNVDQMLVGIAGANVVQNSGEPGSGFSINIRGAGSINAGNSPLYVIDGIPIENERPISDASVSGFAPSRSPRNPLASINPQDIKSIEILKDASATAIYGSRGANGVVLITTKGGQSGEMKVDYHGYLGIQNRFNKLDLLKPEDYKRILNEIIDQGGGDPSNRIGEIANGERGADWQDEVNNSNAMVQNHQLSFSGGSDKTTFYLSLNYMDQEGILKFTDFSRYAARINVESKISEKLNIGFKATGSFSQDDFISNGFGTNENGGVIYAAYNFDPTLAVKNPDGSFITSPLLTIDNPVAIAEGMSSESTINRTLASAFGEYALTSNLYAKVNIGGDFVNESRKSYVSTITKEGRNFGGIAANQNSEKSSYLVEGTLHYNKSFNIHAIDALAGITYQKFATNYIRNSANDFPNDALEANNLGLGNQETFRIDNFITGNRLASYIGRINYSLLDKYLVTATIRADGSSRFGKNNKYGLFPSVALAWKLSEEKFLEGLDAFSHLKLRVSWGQTGNQEIGDFPSKSTYVQGNPAIWDGSPVTATAPARIPNPDLKWEKTEQINFGLDFGFFEDRISGSIDYFEKETTDMLLDLPIPQSTGFNTILTNIGRIDNKGFEFSANTINVSGRNFNWSSNVSVSTIKNTVKDLGGVPEIISGGGYLHVFQLGIIRPGDPLNSFFGWEVEGIWQEEDDFSSTTDNVKPGSTKYVDQNGDGTINDADRVILGNSFPDFQWSFGNTFSYKDLALYVFFEGVEGMEMLNGTLIDSYFPINFRRNKMAEPYLNRWTPDNPTNKYPSFVDPLGQGRKTVNSTTVQDASYIKLRTVRLSYTLPEIVSWLQSAQVYIAGENLIAFTDYIGIDPGINPNSNANLRIDFNAFPTARTFMLGLQLGF